MKFFQWRFGGPCSFYYWLSSSASSFSFLFLPRFLPFDVDSSGVLDDGNQTQENDFIYVPPRGTTQQSNGKVQCYEPDTVKYLGYVPTLTPDEISEHAGWSGCFYFRIIQSALAAIGAPEELVEVITGFAETGEALVSSVDKVIFVGSPGIGKMIMSNAAEKLIPVTLEFGGKDAFIVCEDVDVDHGPPLARKYDMGALCMHAHSEKLQGLINDALDKRAEIIARRSSGHIGEGAVDQYFPRTVIVNVNHSLRLMQQEAFGPIMPIMKFSSDEEVVKLANDSKFGLGCAVFSGSQSRATDIAFQINCGIAAINDFGATYMCQSLPFGGVKRSGFGGAEGLRACCLVKAVVEDRWWPFIKTVIPKPVQKMDLSSRNPLLKHYSGSAYGTVCKHWLTCRKCLLSRALYVAA
ncbi:hypothetical protein LR48_Vigan09g168700 [Vigna angularis]|uniref:Aldehyde dehydrogenase domain-containing protein n=1 Tax=Phaseolus angularis TaxID=3914 RepID=A0A0L9VDF0_PHAAN|nr:hypothetical protein LR48_Vigan09g168700 [Vigna angularis]